MSTALQNKPKPSIMTRIMYSQTTNGLLFVLPWLIGLSVFVLYPAVQAVVMSFQDFNIMRGGVFIGWENYEELVFWDPIVREALKNTLWWVFIAVPSGILVGLTIAILLSNDIKGMRYYRTLFYMPSLVPGAVIVILWRYILNADYGLLNSFLAYFGIEGPLWINAPALRKPSLLMMMLWGAGGPMVIYLAAIKGVPKDLYEAAFIDGANFWRRLFSITLPGISPAILFNFILGLIGAFQFFTEPMIMFGAEAPGATMYATYLYQNAFVFFNMGYASAMAIGLLVISLIFTIVALKITNKYVYYTSE